MAERDYSGVGSARHRRERRLRSWLRHERMTVAAALVSASHRSAQQRQRLESHFAPPVPPQLAVVPAACPRTTVPLLAPAVLGGGNDDGVHSSALGFLMDAALDDMRREQEEEEKKKKEVAKLTSARQPRSPEYNALMDKLTSRHLSAAD